MRRGFTLLEMVLVMSAIVGIFLLTIPNITKTLFVVNDKSCDAQIKVVDAAILQYRLLYDKTPLSIGDLVSEGFLTHKQTKCSNGKMITITNGQAHE